MPRRANPLAGARRSAALTRRLTALYKERLGFYLGIFMQDGTAPGTEPPASREEELTLIAEKLPMLLQLAGQPDAQGQRAQAELRRYYELRGMLGGNGAEA